MCCIFYFKLFHFDTFFSSSFPYFYLFLALNQKDWFVVTVLKRRCATVSRPRNIHREFGKQEKKVKTQPLPITQIIILAHTSHIKNDYVLFISLMACNSIDYFIMLHSYLCSSIFRFQLIPLKLFPCKQKRKPFARREQEQIHTS